jgi:hypothetical protein
MILPNPFSYFVLSYYMIFFIIGLIVNKILERSFLETTHHRDYGLEYMRIRKVSIEEFYKVNFHSH